MLSIIFQKKVWVIRIICGHCGYALRVWDTKGLQGALAPVEHIIRDNDVCSCCKKASQWWIDIK